MQRLPVESSDIVSVGYDQTSRVLEVEFRGSRVYQYLEVTPDIYENFMKAQSYGVFFYGSINGRYRYRKVEKDEAQKKYEAIAIVTGNARKASYFKMALDEFGIASEQLDLPVDEIQGNDPEKIAVHKAKQAYKLANRPVVVDDKFWSILALHGFPGPYMHEVVRWFKPEDFLALLAAKTDRSVTITDTLVYYDGKRPKVFNNTRHGVIIEQPRGDSRGFSIERLTVLQGFDKTMAELADQGIPTFSPQDSAWYAFAKWYHMQRRLRRV